MARRLWLSLFIGGSFFGILNLLGYLNFATPVPFLLLLPGLIVGAATPGSGFELKDDSPWSPLASLVFYTVDIAIYGSLAYLLLNLPIFRTVSPRDR
jgi:hypothetical protein